MAWYDRIKRSVSGVISPKPWLISLFGGNATLSGENVSAVNAPKVSAVYACVNLISGTIASLPFHLLPRNGAGAYLPAWAY
jgi:phage portal protein BeeE